MKIKRLLGALLFFAAATGAWADPLPFDVIFYGIYGAPTQPDSLVHSNYDGLGFGGLAEWNPSYFASLGLSYEQTGFYGNSGFSAGTLNLEGKYYLAAFIQNNAPYLLAGIGINMFTPKDGWPGSLGLKLGLGEKVPFIGPTLFDIGFDYHWLADTNSFQYADLHAGVGYAFDIKGGEPAPTPMPTPKTTPSPETSQTPLITPTATVTPTAPATMKAVSPTVTPTVTPTTTGGTPSLTTDTPTPEIMVESEPTPSTTETLSPVVSKMKKYYHLGVKAFLKRNYKASVADLNVCIGIKDPVVPSFYYAEAYSTLGVIYEFHRTSKGHLDLARKYYRKALRIDPQTATAKKYLAKLTVPKPKPRPKPTATPVADSDSATGTGSASLTPVSNN